jgi:hypothetical protein
MERLILSGAIQIISNLDYVDTTGEGANAVYDLFIAVSDVSGAPMSGLTSANFQFLLHLPFDEEGHGTALIVVSFYDGDNAGGFYRFVLRWPNQGDIPFPPRVIAVTVFHDRYSLAAIDPPRYQIVSSAQGRAIFTGFNEKDYLP